MSTVAEGVETREQLEFLQRGGCNESQGYLHSRSIPAAEFELLLAQHTDLRAGLPANPAVAVREDEAPGRGQRAR